MPNNVNLPNAGNGLGYTTGYNGIPAMYDYQNIYNSSFSPSNIHVRNTQLQLYFVRYLLQRVMSVFKWKMPKEWKKNNTKNYFLYVLYCIGFIGIIETDKYGVICQHGYPYGYNINYQPTHFIISNPLLKHSVDPEIDKDCTVIQLMPDWGNTMDLVNFYADMMALACESMGVNFINTHLAFIFPAESQGEANTYKKMVDDVCGGEVAVAVGKKLFNEDGTVKWQPFQQNLSENFIVPELLDSLRNLRDMFDSEVGIPNTNTRKKERLTDDEVHANDTETKTLCEMWLEQLQEGCEKARNMFGIDLSVDWREEEGETTNGQTSENQPSRSVQMG